MHFLSGKRRRHLFEASDALRGQLLQHRLIQHRRGVRSLRFALRIIGIRAKAESETSRISLAAPVVELHQPRGTPQQKH